MTAGQSRISFLQALTRIRSFLKSRKGGRMSNQLLLVLLLLVIPFCILVFLILEKH